MNVIVRAGRRRWNAWLCGVAMVAAAVTATAHHGWDWAEDAQSTLKGTIESVSMAPPHPSLQVRADDGSTWRVELGNPTKTEHSGFTRDSARPGDPVTVLGNRAKERGKRQMKAVRITLGGRNYDMYPERLQAP